MRNGAITLALIAALLVSACGSSGDDPPPPTQGGPAPSAQKKRKPAEPRGRLTKAEYTALRRALDTLETLDGVDDIARVHRGLARTCRGLRKPNTSVVNSIERECRVTTDLIRETRNALRRVPKCQAAGMQGDTSCFAGSANAMGRTAHLAAAAARRTRAVVGRRRIRGSCAKALVTSRGDIQGLVEFERAMRSLSQALDARNLAQFRVAQGRLDALDFSEEDLSRLIRRCKRS